MLDARDNNDPVRLSLANLNAESDHTDQLYSTWFPYTIGRYVSYEQFDIALSPYQNHALKAGDSHGQILLWG